MGRKLGLVAGTAIAAAAFLGAAARTESAEPAAVPSITREQVDRLVKPLVDAEWASGVVVGIITPQGSQVYGYGGSGAKGVAPDGRSVFEIGSITKAFTGVLLADAVTRKEVALEDPVSKYLPTDTKLPANGGSGITLLHLSTHTSGLPRMPDNFRPKDGRNPYADYTVRQMYDFLAGAKLAGKPGDKSDYSNLGAGLLGHVLALRAGKSYEELLLERVCGPLGLQETRIMLTPEMRGRLVPGHDADGDPVANWDLPTLAGAGALRSTADDMIRFVKANLEAPKGALGPALRTSHEKRYPVGGDLAIGLGWHRSEKSGIVWHNGQTGGYHSFAGFIPERGAGVVVLSSTATGLVDEVGDNLLRLELGLAPKPLALRPSIKLDGPALDAYVGEYPLAPGAVIKVVRQEERLTAQLTGQEALRIHPEAKDRFYYRVVDAQLTFERDKSGKVTGLVLHQNGRELKAPRR
jgi:CubicO group peptidase (beta-lactamase class C family)